MVILFYIYLSIFNYLFIYLFIYFPPFILSGGKLIGKHTYAVVVGAPGSSHMLCVTRAELYRHLLVEFSSFGDFIEPIPAGDGNDFTQRRETVGLSCTKQIGSARSSMCITHPFQKILQL